MTLYNFFTKPTANPESIARLRECCEELRPLCVSILLIDFEGQFTLMGQMLGANTTAGDPDLLQLSGFGYTWVNAHYPHEQETYGWE